MENIVQDSKTISERVALFHRLISLAAQYPSLKIQPDCWWQRLTQEEKDCRDHQSDHVKHFDQLKIDLQTELQRAEDFIQKEKLEREKIRRDGNTYEALLDIFFHVER